MEAQFGRTFAQYPEAQTERLTEANAHRRLRKARSVILMERKGKYIYGRLDLIAFLKRIWPLDQMPSNDSRFDTAEGDIWQHMINNEDWDYDYLFNNRLGLRGSSDDQFFRFLEEMVHPIVRPPDDQEEYASVINNHIMRDGFKLQAHEQISGYQVYRVVRIGSARVEQNVKNLIFAADGPNTTLSDT